MRGALGRAHAEALAALHAELADASPFIPDAAAAGRRALRNVVLGSVRDGDVIGLELAHRQLADADNMTERFGALAAIALKPDSRARARARRLRPALRDGAPHSRQMVLASGAIPEHETLDRVRALMKHRRILARQSQPRARPDRRVLGQSDTVQPRSTAPASPCSKKWSSFSIRPILRSPRDS